jgi:hypothetical protein
MVPGTPFKRLGRALGLRSHGESGTGVHEAKIVGKSGLPATAQNGKLREPGGCRVPPKRSRNAPHRKPSLAVALRSRETPVFAQFAKS